MKAEGLAEVVGERIDSVLLGAGRDLTASKETTIPLDNKVYPYLVIPA